MKTLTLLRHAKSDWDDPVARDFDRPLNARGRSAARGDGPRDARARPRLRSCRRLARRARDRDARPSSREGYGATLDAALATSASISPRPTTLLDVWSATADDGARRAAARRPQSRAGGSGARCWSRTTATRCATRSRTNIPTGALAEIELRRRPLARRRRRASGTLGRASSARAISIRRLRARSALTARIRARRLRLSALSAADQR